ncbi:MULTISPECIES: DUF2795 domain-containing protein [Streptomyces]|uniref:DUF2795 domain-containing protein n=2 Tax=Streptomyces TaxID=1883 RepID=A0ABV9IKK4_9ACTN
MQRGSGRVSAHRDDEMKHELQGLLRSGHPTRTEEWQDPEPPADDDPELWTGPVAPGGPSRPSPATLRLELGRILGRSVFPAGPSQLARALRRRNAPEALVEAVRDLPHKERYANAREVAEALVGSAR